MEMDHWITEISFGMGDPNVFSGCSICGPPSWFSHLIEKIVVEVKASGS